MMALISADKWRRKQEGAEADWKGGMQGGERSIYGSLGFNSAFCIHKVNNQITFSVEVCMLLYKYVDKCV